MPGPLSVAVPGGRIAFRERGSGTPVVFLHGGTGTGLYDWGHVADELSRSYRTIVVDLRAHGASPDDASALGIVRFGLDAVHVLRAVGAPRAALVGFSAGANTLLKLLAREPWRGLALVTVGGSARGDASRVAGIMAGPWPGELRRLEHAVGDGPDYWQGLRASLAKDWGENLAMTDDELRRIACPTLVCHGERDPIQELEYGEHLAAAIPRAELLVVPDTGHPVQRERPDLFVDALEDFFRRALPRR